jgi:GcrA cell cycle regulator
MGWSDAQVASLRQMRAQGASLSNIGQELGYTRSAVAGKVYRLGLSAGAPEHRQQPILRLRQPRSRPEERLMIMKPHKELPPPPAEPTVSHGKPLLELGHDECRWPLDVRSMRPAVAFCGKQALPGRPYCAAHTRLASGGGVTSNVAMAAMASRIEKQIANA